MIRSGGNMSSTEEPLVLDNFLIHKAPPSAYYIPNFISEREENELLNQVYAAPKPKWTQLSGRRLQNWGGNPHAKGMVVEKLPPWLARYASQIGLLPIFNGKILNHVLVNEYEPGQGIMPHEDGPLFYPVVSTINLGSHTCLDFYYRLNRRNSGETDAQNGEVTTKVQNDISSTACLEDRYLMSLLLEPRSLFLQTDELYKCYLHGIYPRETDKVTDNVLNIDSCSAKVGDTLQRSRRVSLTIRNVPNTLKLKLQLGR